MADIPQHDRMKFVSAVMSDFRPDIATFVNESNIGLLKLFATKENISKEELEPYLKNPSEFRIASEEDLQRFLKDPETFSPPNVVEYSKRRGYIVETSKDSFVISNDGKETAQTLIGMLVYASRRRRTDPRWSSRIGYIDKLVKLVQ